MKQPAHPAVHSRVKIWDIWIRVFHWSLATLVVFLLVSGNTGWQFFENHKTAGEAVLALLVFRLCWGLAGSSNARLAKLVVHPKAAFQHLSHLLKGNVPPERGHNAAGGWAVLAMLALLTFQAVSGLFIADEEELIEGALYGTIDWSISSSLLHLHHLNASLIMTIVIVHVLMIFVYLVRAGQNLIKPMMTGSMTWSHDTDPPTINLQHWWIGLGLLGMCIAITGWVVGWW